MQPIMVRPDRFCRSGEPRESFYLLVDEALADDFEIVPDSGYGSYRILAATDSDSLNRMFRSVIPDGADVLVISRRGLARAVPLEDARQRLRVACLPCDTTPATGEHLRWLLAMLERCPSPVADQLRTSLEALDSVRIIDNSIPTTASLRMDASGPGMGTDTGTPPQTGADYIVPGQVLTIASAAGNERLPLSGQLTVKGRPIVRTHNPLADASEQEHLYERLLTVASYPALLHVEDGVVSDVTAVHDRSSQAAEALSELFSTDPRNRQVTRLGIGLDTEMQMMHGNCEANCGYGGSNGRIFAVLGAVTVTRFEVILPCETSSVIDGNDTVLAGQPDSTRSRTPRRRLNRVTSASCGCH